MTQSMQTHATGQMATIMNVQPLPDWATWPAQVLPPYFAALPPWRTLRTVPVMRRAQWQPWPWRTWGRWGWPRRSWGYWDGWGGGWGDGWGRGYGAWGDWAGLGVAVEATAPTIVGVDAPAKFEVVGETPPTDVHVAANRLVEAIHAAAPHHLPPAWAPTIDFQRSFNHSFGALGGLGAWNAPVLLKLDGIYGPSTEGALTRVVGVIQGPQIGWSHEGYHPLAAPPAHAPPAAPAAAVGSDPGGAPYRFHILGEVGQALEVVGDVGPAFSYNVVGREVLSATPHYPQLVKAVQKLSDKILGQMGVVGVSDNAAKGRIDVFTKEGSETGIKRYLGGFFDGFAVDVHKAQGYIVHLH